METSVAAIILALFITITGTSVAGLAEAPNYNKMCPIRYPFGVDSCFAFGEKIPAGKSVALPSPCVLIECSSSGHRVEIEGCPKGKVTCTGSETRPLPSTGAWPLCCTDCDTFEPSMGSTA
uniref:Hypothetical secreted peptide n=1 Tax=Hyalomma rufipes TaxID=72862 RepID=E2J6Q6_HYARU